MILLNTNERSEAIELIKESQRLFDKNNLFFKEAGGERSLKKSNSDSDSRASTLFPDVLYFEDVYQLKVALGWELKLPDTDIKDKEFYENARDKANRLNTNAFVLWNFKEAKVFKRLESDINNWQVTEHFINENKYIGRESVINNKEKWLPFLEKVVLHLNEIFTSYEVTPVPVLSTVENIANDIANKHSIALADYYKKYPHREFTIKIKRWYEQELLEFSNEKEDKVELATKRLMFAKNNLLNWINRITFSNLLKNRHNAVKEALACLISSESTIDEIANLFNEATKVSDFYTILHTTEEETVMPEFIVNLLKEYGAFLYERDFSDLNHEEFQNNLETIVSITKRELMGLYTTPPKLAKLLVNSTINRTDQTVLDPCVGSGTIAKEVLGLIEPTLGLKGAHDNVWASDKYKFPLQIANVSLSSQESLNIANIVFQQNIFEYQPHQKITIIDPEIGKEKEMTVPKFQFVVSNLPFIRNERIDEAEKEYFEEINMKLKANNIKPLNLKSDWYQFGLLKIFDLLDEDGKVGVITSNSLLKTKKHQNYLQTLSKLFHIEQVIISGNGKWFDNADVVTTILILSKKNNESAPKTEFIKLKKNLADINDKEIERIGESILSKENLFEFFDKEEYSTEQIDEFVNYGISLNCLFNDMSWFNSVKRRLIPMKDIFEGKRGIKSTNNDFFYDIDSDRNIEKEFIVKLLKSPRNITDFIANPDSTAFLVKETKEELQKQGKTGAVEYIESLKEEEMKKSQKKLKHPYQLPANVFGDFITSINPDQRLYWSAIPNDLLVDQRCTVFSIKKDIFVQKELLHALLNTVVGQFMIEATGFGRGLGVLDTTKDGILDSYILDYSQLDFYHISEILKRWQKLSHKSIPHILDQLNDKDWQEFNYYVFKVLGIEEALDPLVNSLKKAIELRRAPKI